MSRLLSCCALLLLLATPARAADPVPAADPALARQLDAMQIKYTVDEDGDYQMTFELEDGRTQLVFARSPVESYGSNRVREIWSPGYQSQTDAFPAAVANDLLERSNGLKLGSWVKQDRVAMLVTKISADASADQLDEAIDLTAVAADAVELDLTGKDDL